MLLVQAYFISHDYGENYPINGNHYAFYTLEGFAHYGRSWQSMSNGVLIIKLVEFKSKTIKQLLKSSDLVRVIDAPDFAKIQKGLDKIKKNLEKKKNKNK